MKFLQHLRGATFEAGAGVGECSDGEVGAEGGPCRCVGEASVEVVGVVVDAIQSGGAKDVLGGCGEGVVVASGRIAKQDGRVGLLVEGGGGRGGGVVAGKDSAELVERGRRAEGLGADQGVRVAVVTSGHVEVVAAAAARGSDVQESPVFFAGQDGVRGVDGDALGAMDGGRVSELHVLAHVLRRQQHRSVRACDGGP